MASDPPQWEQTENKASIALYAGGSFAAIWLSSAVLGAVNSVPLARARARLGRPRARVAARGGRP